MSTTRWQPFSAVWSEMSRLQEEREQRLGRHGMDAPRQPTRNVDPPLNVWEDDNNLYVEAELPELDLGDLEILVNGVVTVHLPKSEKVKPRRIEVKCG